MLYYFGKGRYQDESRELWDNLVPASGQAESIQGEMVRVIARLASEFYRNGNANWNIGFRMYTNVLVKHLRDKQAFDTEQLMQIEEDIAEIRDFGSGKKDLVYEDKGEDAFDRINDRVIEWCRLHPNLIPNAANPKLKQ